MAATISTTAVVIPVVVTASARPIAINPKVPRPITTANPMGSNENSVR
jgi:hypothetical protein